MATGRFTPAAADTGLAGAAHVAGITTAAARCQPARAPSGMPSLTGEATASASATAKHQHHRKCDQRVR